MTGELGEGFPSYTVVSKFFIDFQDDTDCKNLAFQVEA